ncbi:hypothetical protein CONLIGDRAFT_664828 [Coniochaeta ligniaria NRRL 30616]|uniref:DUF676 domain-containing protein n=1 Tax=Coniochaeta ligniaria NRRL 30616 TaxID=1408157 RepID=A0A1J7J5N2_9PEZI|nr:hypothetical protein CONLIGDRAFT_664828 [Coniochaeta ligniaria NRRL 30616]
MASSPSTKTNRVLLLCFIHGFKGNDDTFQNFPDDLKKTISSNLGDEHIESVVYPKYETKGELAQSTEAFLEWLKERVMEVRKSHLSQPWPPNDRNVGVILVAHSMGGFVAVDTLFRILNDRAASDSPSSPMFPLVQGILTFDTPFNGLARSMFVYGAFSNYSKVSNVFNVMTAVAAAPASIAKLGLKQSARRAAAGVSRTKSSSPAIATWQLVAVRTGTVGAIAAGGVAAYMHRKQIIEGLSSMRNLNKESVVQGYQSSVDALGQGLAYINRGNVGKSFAWLSEHFTFVGALLKQNELSRRLERMASLKGVGIADLYASMGENGYWSGGYFVPERTFCAVPARDQPAAGLFSRIVVEDADDEIQAHMNMFKPDKNKNYEVMTSEAAKMAVRCFNDETEVWDDPKFALAPSEPSEEEVVAKAVEGSEDKLDSEKVAEEVVGSQSSADSIDGASMPDESPIDIAAAASLVPLPDDIEDEISAGDGKDKTAAEKQAYMRYLFGVAQQTGTNLKSYLPSKLPTMDQMSMPKVSMPVSMPNVSMPSMSMPSVSMFSKKSTAGSSEPEPAEKQDEEKKEVEPGMEVGGKV